MFFIITATCQGGPLGTCPRHFYYSELPYYDIVFSLSIYHPCFFGSVAAGPNGPLLYEIGYFTHRRTFSTFHHAQFPTYYRLTNFSPRHGPTQMLQAHGREIPCDEIGIEASCYMWPLCRRNRRFSSDVFRRAFGILCKFFSLCSFF